MSPSTPQTQSEPNVIPFIDVLLALLVLFFTVIAIEKAKEAEKQKAIFAQSPPDSAARSDASSASIVLEVNPDGYRVNGTRVADDELDTHLHAIYVARPDKVLFVKGDPAVTYQEVITAMDIARGAGVRVLGILPRR